MRITTIIFAIFGLFLLTLIPAASEYFPWEGGFKVGTSEYIGHQYADQLQSAAECNEDPEMLPDDKEFQAGCRAYFE